MFVRIYHEDPPVYYNTRIFTRDVLAGYYNEKLNLVGRCIFLRKENYLSPYCYFHSFFYPNIRPRTLSIHTSYHVYINTLMGNLGCSLHVSSAGMRLRSKDEVQPGSTLRRLASRSLQALQPRHGVQRWAIHKITRAEDLFDFSTDQYPRSIFR